MKRRHLLQCAASAWPLFPRIAAANTPLRVIVPFAPGGPSDVVLRAIEPLWRQRTGQPLVVEHRGGASGTLGAEAARRAKPDGHTLLFAPADVLVNNTAIFHALPYDPLRDFQPIVQIGPIPLVLAVPASVPADSLTAFAAWATGRRIGYGSWGEGSHAHLLGEALLVRRLRLDAVHAPYRGLGPMAQDLIGGQVSAAFVVPPAAAPHVKAGRLRALAVTGDRRSTQLPQAPTLPELGHADPVFRLRQWAAFLAPARMPAETLAQLEVTLTDVLDDARVRETLLVAGFELDRVLGSDEARASLRADLALVPALIRELGVPQQ